MASTQESPSDAVDSTCKREALRRQLQSRRTSLRLPEASFLDLVIEVGSEEEISNAHNVLLNDRLFFTHDESSHAQEEAGGTAFLDGKATLATEFRKESVDLSEDAAGVDRNTSNDNDNDDDASATEKKEDDDAPASRPLLHRSMGSSRRMNHLRRRLSSLTQIGLWRAHQSAVSPRLKRASFRLDPDISIPPDDLDRESFIPSINPGRFENGNNFLDDSEVLDDRSVEERSVDFHRRKSVRTKAMSIMFQSIAEIDSKLSDDSEESGLTGDMKKDDLSNLSDKGIESGSLRTDVGSNASMSVRKPLITRRASMNIYGGEGFEVGQFDSMSSLFGLTSFHSDSQSDVDTAKDEGVAYDPWNDEIDKDSGSPFSTGDFLILGTHADDESCYPHILSPPNMLALQQHLPFGKRGESFWLKYSLVRDGASAKSFLQQMRGSQYTLLAMETLDGEVFGAFTSSSWHVAPSAFGDAGDSFVWRMKEPRTHDRNVTQEAISKQSASERNLDVYKFTHRNKAVQMCASGRIALGGGSLPGVTPMYENDSNGNSKPRMVGPLDWGFALAFEEDYMLEATSSPSVTFFNPPLCAAHADGSRFELVNLEAWTMTPCRTVEEAEVLECGHLFLKRHLTI